MVFNIETEIFLTECCIINKKLISEANDSVNLENEEKRIAHLIEAMGRHELNFLHNLKIDGKRSDESKKFRSEGNRHFQSTASHSLDKAVEEYTKAVAHAPTRSEELGLAYANRSAALFKAKLFSDCLLDIERALKNNYPDDLKAKLFMRKAMCLQILNSDNDPAIEEAFNEAQKWTKKMDKTKQPIMKKMLEEQKLATSINKFTFSKWPYKKFMPKLDAENPTIPGLSDAVELQYSKKYGRHMIATRDIKPGEVLCVQKAYAKVVLLSSRYYLCWNCGEQTWASVPCERCVEVIFCSEACREEGNREHHEIECPVISSLIALGIIEGFYIPLRVLVQAFRETKTSFETLRNIIQEIDGVKNPLLKGFKDNMFDPCKFASIYSLKPNSNKEIMFKASAEAILIVSLLATKTDFFGSKMNGDLNHLKEQNNFIFIVALLDRMFSISNSNQVLMRGRVHGNKTCCMIVPVYSFFNHSCYSMIDTTHHGDYLANTAIAPIKKGQQIFGNYGLEYEKVSRDVRRKYFLENYNFSCQCEACENDWPLDRTYKSSKSRLKNNHVLTKLLQDASNMTDKLLMVTKVASSFGPKHGQIYDSKKDITAVVQIIETFYRLGFKPFSVENCSAKSVLQYFLILNENRFLSLN